MVYQPYAAEYTKKRNISQTRPSIKDDDDITAKSKDLAVSKSLNNKEQTPSVMPTGNQKAPAVAARETIVNSAEQQAQKQGTAPNIGNIKAAPSFDMSMARKAGSPSTNTIPAAEPENNIDTEGYRDFDATPIDFNKFNEFLGGQGNGQGDGQGGDDGGSGLPEGFGDALKQKLMEILEMDASERARNEAGRALLAARSQAGRGQMGMSGAMLGLQSDVMGEAALRAEDYLMDQQIDAARTGVRLEAMDRAEQLGLIDWVRSATQQGSSPEEIMEMLATLGVSGEDAEALLSGAGGGEEELIFDNNTVPSNYQSFLSGAVGFNPDGAVYYEGHIGFDAGLIVPLDANLPAGVGTRKWGVREIDGVFYHKYTMEDSEGNEYVFYTPTEENP